MLRFSKWQIGFVAIIVAFGAFFSVQNFIPKSQQIPGFFGKRLVLGLDLQGGSELRLEVDTDTVIAARLESTLSDVRIALRGRRGENIKRIQFSNLRSDGKNITVKIHKAADMDVAEDRLQGLSRALGRAGMPGGLGGVQKDLEVTRLDAQQFQLTFLDDAISHFSDQAVVQSIETIRRRIDGLGTTEPSIQRQGSKRILVKVPGNEDSEGLKSVINRTGTLTFHLVDDDASVQDAIAGSLPPRRILVEDQDSAFGYTLLHEEALITGNMVEDASATPNADQGGFQVNFEFDRRGARLFADATRENVGRRFAVVLDDKVITAPVINTPILGGSGRITGNFTAEESFSIALLIRSGALPAPLQVLEQRTVGADLGRDSVRAGAIALVISFLAVVVYMAAIYGRFGIYANLALIANVLMLFGVLSMLGATLTLPGIAGVVLTIGMAVDANVLIFERIREELANGKQAVVATQTGYKKAWSAIADANITTFLAAAIMFYLGSGPVRGFAVTLAIGVLTSVFASFVITRIFTGWHVLNNRTVELKL